ncbi:MAG: hypothetical protein WA419_10235 [Silvibacterium sp.]
MGDFEKLIEAAKRGALEDVRAIVQSQVDPPGSGSTQPVSINPAGEITGNYFDQSFQQHGFLRTP